LLNVSGIAEHEWIKRQIISDCFPMLAEGLWNIARTIFRLSEVCAGLCLLRDG
jgi:hypothetical protein